MHKKKSITSTILSIISITSLGAFSFAHAEEQTDNKPVTILTPDNAPLFGIDFQKAQNALREEGFSLEIKSIGIKFHEEDTKVDLSSLSGLVATVEFSAVRSTENEIIWIPRR